MKNNAVTVKRDGEGRLLFVRRIRHTLMGTVTVTDRYGVDGRVLRRYVTKRNRNGGSIYKKLIRENGKCTLTLREREI